MSQSKDIVEEISEKIEKNTTGFTDIVHEYKDLADRAMQRAEETLENNKRLLEHIQYVNKILKQYARLDPLIISILDRKAPGHNFGEGLATEYLKAVGEYDLGEYGN